MKKKQTILAITVGILLLAFIPAVQAKTTKRHIDDWVVPDLGINPHVVGWGDPDSNLAVFPHFGAPFVWDPFAAPFPIWECDYSGYLLEKELKDGRFGYKLYLTVRDVPFVVNIDYGAIFVGMMHYTFALDFIIDPETYPEEMIVDGVILMPPLVVVLFFGWESIEVGNSKFTGAGDGYFLEAYEGWEAGEFAMMKVNQLGMVDKNFKPDHPNYFGPDGFWPVEFLFFH